MSIHEGHRLRLKSRFIENGLDSFEDHNALELLLFYTQPRRDTNQIAHRLIDRFGTFDAVFDATIDELKQVEGIGENAAIFLKLIIAANRRYMISKNKGGQILNSTEKAGKFLVPRFYGERDEVVYMVCLDAKHKAINCKLLFRGSVDTASINVRKVVENALAYNSMSAILAHNHISGVALPSEEDKDTTLRVIEALRAVDVKLTDHIIVADGDFVSMADNGFFVGV